MEFNAPSLMGLRQKHPKKGGVLTDNQSHLRGARYLPARVPGRHTVRKLADLSEAERAAIVTAEALSEAFGQLGAMKADGVEQVLILLQQMFAPTIENSERRERMAFHHLVMMVQAFGNDTNEQTGRADGHYRAQTGPA